MGKNRSGTTNETAVEALSAKLNLGIVFAKGRDHAESFRLFTSGATDAFAADDVLLLAKIAETRAGAGGTVSMDPPEGGIELR